MWEEKQQKQLLITREHDVLDLADLQQQRMRYENLQASLLLFQNGSVQLRFGSRSELFTSIEARLKGHLDFGIPNVSTISLILARHSTSSCKERKAQHEQLQGTQGKHELLKNNIRQRRITGKDRDHHAVKKMEHKRLSTQKE